MESNDSLPLTVTHAWLVQHEACKEEADLFRTIWPNGTGVTQEALATAASAGLNLEWFAKRVLSPTIYADYLTARTPFFKDYEAKRKLLLVDYHAKCAPLLAEYLAKHALLLAEYAAEDIPLHGGYDAKHVSLLTEYEAKRAPLLAHYAAKDIPLYGDYTAKGNTLLISILGAAYKKEASHNKA